METERNAPADYSGGGSGESNLHARRKMQAMRALLDRFDHERYTTEEYIDGKRCDALVVLEDPHETYGNGFVVEYQYKNEQKDIEATERHYARNNLTTLWLWEDEFSFEGVVPDVDLFDGRVFTPWPQTVPTCDEWSGISSSRYRLQAMIGKGTTTRVDATLRGSFVMPSEQEYWQKTLWLARFSSSSINPNVDANVLMADDYLPDISEISGPVVAKLPPNCVDDIIYHHLNLRSLPRYKSRKLIDNVIEYENKQLPDAMLPPNVIKELHSDRRNIESADELRHRAIDNGWRESLDKSPFKNLQSALETTAGYIYSRPVALNFASLYITGFGGGKVTKRAIERMTDPDDSEYSPNVGFVEVKEQ
jgi:hypothetical protein